MAPVAWFDNISGVGGSSGFRDFTRLDAGRADFHPARATLGRLYANRLQVRIEAAWGSIVRVRDIVAELRSLAADFTTFGHLVFATSVIRKPRFIANAFPARQASTARKCDRGLKVEVGMLKEYT